MDFLTIPVSASNGRRVPRLAAMVVGIDDFRGSSHGTPSSITEAPNTDRSATGESVCHCGHALTTCPGCTSGRCLACDPYSSDDCRYRDL